jgi:hypothetical protein
VPVRELWLLVEGLLKDTRSWVFAAINEWEYPVSREWLLAADQFDMFARAHTPKKYQRQLKPHPRPFSTATEKRYGGRNKNRTRRTPEEVRALFGRT